MTVDEINAAVHQVKRFIREAKFGLAQIGHGREIALVITKLDEAELWLRAAQETMVDVRGRHE